MIKTKFEQIADCVYRFKRRFSGISLPDTNRKKFSTVKPAAFRQKFFSIFNEEFALCGFERVEHEERRPIWIRSNNNSEGMIHFIDVNTIQNYLPTYFGIMPFIEVGSIKMIHLINQRLDSNYEPSTPFIRVRLADVFPRTEKVLDSMFDLTSFEHDQDADEMLRKFARLVIEKSERVFSAFTSVDDVLVVYKSGVCPWGKTPHPLLPFKKVLSAMPLDWVENAANKRT